MSMLTGSSGRSTIDGGNDPTHAKTAVASAQTISLEIMVLLTLFPYAKLGLGWLIVTDLTARLSDN